MNVARYGGILSLIKQFNHTAKSNNFLTLENSFKVFSYQKQGTLQNCCD